MKIKKFIAISLAAVISVCGNTHAAEKSSKIKKIVICGIPLVAVPLGIYAIHKLRTNKKTSPAKAVVSNSNSKKSSEVAKTPVVSTTQKSYFDNWIKILSGEEVSYSAFPYKSGNELRQQNDIMLESCHNYIQVFFPNLVKSNYHQENLFINNCKNEWRIALNNDPILLGRIQIQLKLNLVRMLQFWGFDVESREINPDSKNIVIEKISVKSDVNPNDFNNHNNQRVTRVLHSLRLFGLHEEHQKFLQILNTHYSHHSSSSYWNSTKDTPLLTDLLNEQN